MKQAIILLCLLSGTSSISSALPPTSERQEIIAAYFHGWNVRSMEEVLGTMNDDVVYQDPFSGPLRGKRAIERYFAGLLQQFPVLSLHVMEINLSAPQCSSDDDSMAVASVRYISEITASNGQVFRNVGRDCFSFSEGKIRSLRAY